MAQSQVAILGTGLIGASIGMNLTAREKRTFEVVGADRDRANAKAAKKAGAIDRDVASIEEAVSGAGLVIISVPVLGARQLLEEMAQFLQPGTVVTDTCSTKSEVMRWADELLPEGVHFVGGHPMAGKEKSGPEAASKDLFKGATWAVTPSAKAAEEAIQVVLGLIELAGANALYIDPEEHDQYAAAVSHVPMMLSVALFRMVRDSAGWEDASLLAGPGFRDVTRLASGNPAMAHDILETNKGAVLHWLQRYRDEIETVIKAVELGGQPVTDLLTSTALDRDTFIMNPPSRRRPEGVEPPSSQDAIGRLFVGGLYDKLKEYQSRKPTASDDPELRQKLGVPEKRRDR